MSGRCALGLPFIRALAHPAPAGVSAETRAWLIGNSSSPPRPLCCAVVSKEVTGFPSMVEDTEAWVEFISDESNLDALIESLESM